MAIADSIIIICRVQVYGDYWTTLVFWVALDRQNGWEFKTIERYTRYTSLRFPVSFLN